MHFRHHRVATVALLAAAPLAATTGSLAAPSETAAPAVTQTAAAASPGARGERWSLADSPERVVIISDSAIAGIRWTASLGHLTNAHWVDRLESCRRLVRDSCRGREGYRPLTAELELQRLVGDAGLAGPDDVLVMATGYNDAHASFRSDFTTVMEQARRSGFQHIAWMTYREAAGYRPPGDPAGITTDYAAMNAVLRSELDSGRWPELTLFDYDAATRDITDWFASDLLHLSSVGGPRVAQWLSSQIRYAVHPELAPAHWVPYDAR